MNKIVTEIIQEMEAGHDLALATILTRHGSAPRTAGAEMIIRPDGSISGTIGGGQLEAKSINAAREVIKLQSAVIKEFYLTGIDAASTDMICGGNQEILIEYLNPENSELLRQLKAVDEMIRLRKRGWWLTSLKRSSDSGLIIQHGVVDEHGQVNISAEVQKDAVVDPQNLEIRLNGQVDPVSLAGIRSTQIFENESTTWIVNPIDLQGTVYLFGGGHVSQQVAKITNLVGFRTVVIDDRPEFVAEDRFPQADELIYVPTFEECFGKINLDSMSYLVIVTRGHLSDHTVLRQALKSGAVYIGMIGSKRKNQTILNALADEGFEAEDLARVYAPIGLEIEAETPEEIAVSIVGELIKVRAELIK